MSQWRHTITSGPHRTLSCLALHRSPGPTDGRFRALHPDLTDMGTRADHRADTARLCPLIRLASGHHRIRAPTFALRFWAGVRFDHTLQFVATRQQGRDQHHVIHAQMMVTVKRPYAQQAFAPNIGGVLVAAFIEQPNAALCREMRLEITL
ncbi:hypothetical protein GCM10017783_23280 [Deinococcus piscis]|uniref:Uncharacterized protein n=1 Tax=Deinococcus piscis TaxID=394230 RepID=A0ABQ3K9T7_9DEIO|nr:hypothetical protein GCM10017783_23280 [Deinococcus piscis]